jgi:hypothetical protein
MASAATLTIDSSLSSLQFGFSLVSLVNGDVIGTFVGQGDVPQGTLPSGDGTRFPGFSNGLAAQPTGSINVTPGGFSIDGGSKIGLLDSGIWQPGVKSLSGFLPAPVSAELGAYLQTSLEGDAPDTFVSASVTAAFFNLVSSGPLTLGPGGTFDDPLGLGSLVSGNLAFSAINPLTSGGVLNALSAIPPATGAFDLSGTYLDGQLSLLVSGSLTADATALFLGLPIGILITVNGNIVTTPVPEPTSVTLIIIGALFGLVLQIARTARGYTMP